MKRSAAVMVGVCLLLMGGLSLGSAVVRAGEKDVKTIEKRIEIVERSGGFLGVGLEEVDGDARGAKVTSVRSDSAAAEAGVREGDVITSFDGAVVRSALQLRRLVSETPPGRTVSLEVRRDGSTMPVKLSATLGEGNRFVHRGTHGAVKLGEGRAFLPDVEDLDVEIHEPPHVMGGPGPHVLRWFGDGDNEFTMAWPPRPRLGIRFIELGDQLAEYFGLSSADGVLVTSVEKGSPAEDAGLEAGDVLLQVDGTPIRGGRDLQSQVRRADAGTALTLSLQRKGRSLEVKVTLPESELKKRHRAAGVSL